MSRTVEIFSAGCGLCTDIIDKVKEFACYDCVVIVRDTHDSATIERTKHLGIKSLPALYVDGHYVPPHPEEGYTEDIFIAAGLKTPKD